MDTKPDNTPIDHSDNTVVPSMPVDPSPLVDTTNNQTSEENVSKSNESTSDAITSDQINELKEEAIQYAKAYAKTGTSTRKEPAPNLANDKGPYYWWEKEATYESNSWSISYWEYDNGLWQLQATKVELQPNGHSRMTAYSMRNDNDQSFPGFQIYREQMDDRYHPAAIEEIVYLNRVLKGLVDSSK